jgi:hypothetical protein
MPPEPGDIEPLVDPVPPRLPDVLVEGGMLELVVGDMVDEVEGDVVEEDDGMLDEGVEPVVPGCMPVEPPVCAPDEPDIPPAGVAPAPPVVPPLWASAMAGTSANAVAMRSLRIILSCLFNNLPLPTVRVRRRS